MKTWLKDWRVRTGSAVEEEKRGKDGKRRKWQGVKLLKLQPDSMIYIEAFVKMPYRPEQETNYKSHTRMKIYTYTHKHKQLKERKK